MKKTLSFILSALMTAQLAVASPVNAVETDSKALTQTTDDAETFSFDFYLKTVDSDDGSLIPGADIKLVEYEKFNDRTLFPIENEKYALRTLAEWNTSDVNPFIIHLDDLDVDHYYAVQCDKLPEGYFSGTLHNSYFLTARSGSELKSFMEGENQEFNKGIYQIRLNKGQPYENWSFPKTLTAEFTFVYLDLMDIQKDWATAEIIPDLEVEVVSVTKNEYGYVLGDKIGTFNTSDGEIKITREVSLKDIDDCVCFGLKINNIPDKYAAHYKEYLHSDCVDNYKVAYFSAINTVLGNTNNDFVLVPAGAPVLTGTTTATTTTTTTTNKVHELFRPDYITGISYSGSSMYIGETKKIYFYNSSTGMCDGLGRVEVDPEIMTYTYDEDSEAVILKAVGPGTADIWIYEATCGIGANIKITVQNKQYIETTTTTKTTAAIDQKGNVNCDDQINMADAVLIMQSIINPDKYKLTEQGEKNADVDGSGDVTNNDALIIQRFKLNLISSLS